MKNLFKNLMLVAVAAMAFTSCSQDVNELNKLEKKTVYNFQANIADDDTRSGFMEKEDGATAYKSEWYDGDEIKVFVEDNDGYAAEVTTSIDKDGNFSFELTDAPENFFVTVCSPAESWTGKYSSTIPVEQTPLANSVDPKAHLLQCQGVPVSNGESSEIKMIHQVAYGKMTVSTPEEFVIDRVVIDLVGTFYGYSRELSYTINADNVVNNTFWFATEPIEVAEFTVTAYDAEGNAVTKSVDVAAAGKTLAFNYGRVSTFSVSGLEAPVVPAFTSASAAGDYYDCYLTFTSDDLGTLVLDAYYILTSELELPIGTYGFGSWGGSFYDDGYSYFTPVGGSECDLYSGSVDVKVVDDQYYIEFINLADGSGNIIIENAIFAGLIDGLNVPDPRIQLDAPNVTSQISGKTITLSWDPVTGADSYTIEIYSDAETVEPVSTTETTFEYTVKNYDSYYSFKVTAVVAEDDAEYRNSGYAGYAEYTDPREQLPAPTNVTATVDGLYVTITWDKVDNAVGYEVNYYDNEDKTKSTTETSITLEMSTYNYEYWFYLSSIADENSDSYRSSGKYDASVTAKTDKDPNGPIADVMATNFAWNSAKDCFDLIVPGFDYFYLQVNSANRPGNNSLLEGDYTYGQNENQFRVRYNNGFVYNYSDTNSNSTMNVRFVDGEYVIIINVNTNYGGFVGSIGYKGMPEGWVAPGTGGSGDDTPEESIVVALTSKGAATYANEYAKSFALSDVSNVNSVRIVFDNGNITGESIAAGSYTWVNSVNNVNNSSYSFINRSLCVNGVSYGNDAVSSAYCVVDDNGVITLEFTVAGRGVVFIYDPASDSGNTGGDSGDSGDNTGDGDNTGGGGNTDDGEWSGRDVKLNLLGYDNGSLYTNVNGEGKYFMTSFRNGIVAGTFVLAGDNKSYEILSSGHATSQSSLFGGTTPFADGDTVEVINNGGGSYTIIYRVTVGGEKLTATYNGGL